MSEAPSTQQITVRGMTCDHCVAAVRDELSQLPGVTSVRVDLSSGRVDIAATAPLAGDALAAAVDEAGYSIAEPLP